MRLHLDLIQDEARPEARRIKARALDRNAMGLAVASAMTVPVQRNFRALGVSEHNQFGAPSSGFWQRMNAGVVPGTDGSTAWVRTPREVALRYFGGTVVPKVAKALAIPACAEAYNQSPRAFSDLRFALIGGKTPALVQAAQQSVRYRTYKKTGVTKVYPGAVKGGKIYYWLVPSATINPNPAVLPSLEVMKSTALSALQDYLRHHPVSSN